MQSAGQVLQSMNRFRGKVAVVTGASSGIGAAIAQKLVEEGLQVVGLARRLDLLENLSKSLEVADNGRKGRLHPFKADVTREEEIRAAFQWALTTLGPVHVLVNNAGVLIAGSLLDGNTADWKTTLDTNVLALCVATREAVKIMRANGVLDGHIVHISSITGRNVPTMPKFNIYPGSKHAVTALTEGLRQELKAERSKIKVSCVSPGIVDTGLFDANGFPLPENIPSLQPRDVAEAVAYVLSTPPNVQVHDLIIKPLGEELQ